jgi:hypothetical protein
VIDFDKPIGIALLVGGAIVLLGALAFGLQSL